ncbi:MAG TPA: HAD family phosphatase [Chitinophagaceae bacterium]|nr:HAD family phosphatase [Chitinophagaceae bacterium]
MKKFSVIFDMDGTLVDNNAYHLKAWQAFFKAHGKTLTERHFTKELSGIDSANTIRIMLGNHLSDEAVAAYRDEKEQLYRRLITPHIQPLAGLVPLVQTLTAAGIPLGIATSATWDNIAFTLRKLNLEPYFKVIVDATMVDRGKPDPAIYLMTAAKLAVPPGDCIVFEDSLHGIKSARDAGMKVIALTTSHDPESLRHADEVTDDYTGVNLSQLCKIAQRP